MDDGISKLWIPRYNDNYSREYFPDPQLESVEKLPLHLYFVNEEFCYKDYYRKRECSNVFSIEFVLEGSMLFKQSDVEFRVMPGDIFFIHLNQDVEYMTGPENCCHRLACCIGGNQLMDLLTATHIVGRSVMTPENKVHVESIMRNCITEYRELRENFRLRASVLCYELMLLLGQDIRSSEQPVILRKSIDYMEHHISRKITLKQLASAVGTSSASLHRLFQVHLKTSPMHYLIDLKMKVAKSLLLNTKYQIQEIANRTGYSNPLYFSSEFTKHVGISPRNYRKHKLNGQQSK